MTLSFSDTLTLLIPGVAEHLITIAEQNNNALDLSFVRDIRALRNGIYTGVFLSVIGAVQAAYPQTNDTLTTLHDITFVTGSTVFAYNGLQLHQRISEYNQIILAILQNDDEAQDQDIQD